MAVGSLFRYAQRALFAKPTPERQLLKLVKQQPIRRVLEVGIDSLDTSEQLLQALGKQAGGDELAYTAIDAFEERDAGASPLPLMQAYRRLIATGAKVRLTPGALAETIAAEANSLADTDLLLLSTTATDAQLETAWYYVPRMCHPGTLVLRRCVGPEDGTQDAWNAVPLEEIAARANKPRKPPLRLAA